MRVSPWFWVITVLLGLNTDGQTPPLELIIWIAVVFVSILVHELGHAFTQRHFGGQPWITLYGMGGLASCDDCDRRPSEPDPHQPRGAGRGVCVGARRRRGRCD